MNFLKSLWNFLFHRTEINQIIIEEEKLEPFNRILIIGIRNRNGKVKEMFRKSISKERVNTLKKKFKKPNADIRTILYGDLSSKQINQMERMMKSF